MEKNEGEKTCGKNNEQKKGKIDPCGECSKPVKEKPWGEFNAKYVKYGGIGKLNAPDYMKDIVHQQG